MYITFYKNRLEQQLRFDDLFNNFGTTDINIITPNNSPFPRKITVWNPNFNTTNQPMDTMKTALENNRARVWDMYNMFQMEPEAYYDSFLIPKHSGGMRRIDAPKPELKHLLRDIKNIFEDKLKFLPHDRAFAYVKHRSTKDALTEHQRNGSKWFLKLDMKDFFPSCTMEIIMDAMHKVFPFKILLDNPDYFQDLLIITKLCLFNGSLPQGTPMSPLLTNLVMVHYDYILYKELNDFEKQHFIYTRYADDLLISSKYDFDKEKVFNKVQEIIEPFRLKPEKTRYGSSAGRNWNLGLMLNKDNEITVGYKRKQRLKATLFTFLQDFTNNNRWDRINTEVLLGQVAYYQKVEPEYIAHVIEKYNEKFNVNFSSCAKEILRAH
jgi:hypothetical protein